MIFMIIKRKNVRSVERLIMEYNPTAFYSIEDIKNANQGVFTPVPAQNLNTIRAMFPLGKAK